MARRAVSAFWTVSAMLAFLFVVGGCGQETPERTVYKFLGAVQSRDNAAMRSCVNPEALEKVTRGEGELARAWDSLYRVYFAEPVNWRMAFEGIELESDYLDGERALVSIASGRCAVYRLEGGRWREKGEIDFAREDFVPLYMVRRNGKWYMEALDLYVINSLEKAAGKGTR